MALHCTNLQKDCNAGMFEKECSADTWDKCYSTPIGFGSVTLTQRLHWTKWVHRNTFLRKRRVPLSALLFLWVCVCSCEPLHTDIYISFIVWGAKQRPTCAHFWETYLGPSRACLTCTSPSTVQLLPLPLVPLNCLSVSAPKGLRQASLCCQHV